MGRLIALLLIGVTLLLAAGGCSAAHAPALGASRQWINQQGGLSPAAQSSTQRLEQVASMLGGAIGASAPLNIQILQHAAPQAFAWRNGEIYVTTGLLERMTDAELIAVIAHEIGHLLEDGQLQPVWSVAGRGSLHRDVEFAADADAIKLLDRMNIPRASLRTALSKVMQSQPAGSSTRSELARRIDILP